MPSSLPTYLADPNRRESLDEVNEAYVRHFLSLRLAALKKPMTLDQFRELDSETNKEFKYKMITLALTDVVQAQAESTELIDRAMTLNIVRVARDNGQVLDESVDPDTGERKALEDPSILTFLERKMAHVKSEGFRSELKQLADICVAFYAQGQGDWVEDTLRNRDSLSKLLKGLKPVKDLQNQVVAARQRFDEQLKAKRELSTRLYIEADAEPDQGIKEQILARRENLKQEIKEIEEKKDEVVAELQAQVADTLFTVSVMAHMEEVPANPSKHKPDGIKQLIAKGVKVKHPKKLNADGEETEEEDESKWVLDYPKGKPLPNTMVGQIYVSKMFVNGHIAYVMESPMHDSDMIERMIEQIGEIHTVDPLNGIQELITNSELEVPIWKRLDVNLKKKQQLNQANTMRNAKT